MKRSATWIGIAFIIFYIAFRPDSAHSVITSIYSPIDTMISGFGEFFKKLAE